MKMLLTLFSWIDICSDDIKALEAEPLAHTEAVASDYTHSHCILFPRTCGDERSQLYLEMSLISFIKSLSLSTHLFNSHCDTWGVRTKHS